MLESKQERQGGVKVILPQAGPNVGQSRRGARREGHSSRAIHHPGYQEITKREVGHQKARRYEKLGNPALQEFEIQWGQRGETSFSGYMPKTATGPPSGVSAAELKEQTPESRAEQRRKQRPTP